MKSKAGKEAALPMLLAKVLSAGCFLTYPQKARRKLDVVCVGFILAKVIELFGFVAYPDMDFSDCTPNKLFQNESF